MNIRLPGWPCSRSSRHRAVRQGGRARHAGFPDGTAAVHGHVADLQAGNRVKNDCGALEVQMVTTEVILCPKCYKRVPASYLLCPNCGKVLIGQHLFRNRGQKENQDEQSGRENGMPEDRQTRPGIVALRRKCSRLNAPIGASVRFAQGFMKHIQKLKRNRKSCFRKPFQTGMQKQIRKMKK